MKIKLNISLTPKQKQVLFHPARFKNWKAGRRGGKSYGLGYFLASEALTRPRDKHWYVTKTLALAREEFFPALMDLLPRDYVSKVDDRSLNVKLTNGSYIWCKSAEKEDNLRGRGLGSCVLDEAAFIKPIWHSILRPQLAASKGRGILASSPKKGWFTQQHREVLASPPPADGKTPEWAAFHSTIYDNPHISPEEIEAIKARTPRNTWLQEYMAEEVSDDGQVYAEFSERNIFDPRERFTDVRTFAVVRGLDHGSKADTACAWIGISPEGYLVIFDEYSEDGSDYARKAEQINQKSHGLSIKASVLDRSAFRDIGTGVSMAQLYSREGVHCQESERDVEASIDIMRRFINGDGTTPWLYVSSKCAKVIEAFQQWEQGDHEPDIAAAARYGAVWSVVKKLTRLHDAVPTFRHTPTRPVSEAEAQTIFAAQARIVPTHSRKQWGWDSTVGVPQ